MESQMSTNMTQASQRKLKVDSIIDEFISYSRSVGVQERADVDPNILNFTDRYFAQLEVETRRAKLFNFVTKSSDCDYFYRFVSAWLNLLRLVETNQETHRLAALRAIFTQFETKAVSVHNFVPVYNLLCSELPKVSHDGLVTLVEMIKDRIMEPVGFLKRWRDCVLVLLTHLTTLEKIDGEEDGKNFVSSSLQTMMGTVKHPEMFRHLLGIAKDLGMSNLVDTYICDSVLENIEETKVESSWKVICALEHVDQKRAQRIFLALNTVWQTDDEFSLEFMALFPLFRKILEESSVGKAFSTLLKQQPGAVLCSQFGFLAVILMCGIERYKVETIQEIKKTLLKLWKFDEKIGQFGWLKATDIGRTAETIRQQTMQLINWLAKEGGRDGYWSLFGDPLLNLGYALVDISNSKEVKIVDGRVADDGSICLFAKKILIDILLANPSTIPSQLRPVLHAIASSGNSGSALVLIDILVEIVKKCTVDVLNNSKLLDGLFDYICKMRRDVGVSLVRCLLPVINQRAKLRETLFRNLKNEMLNETTVGSAIPILILLLRSVSRKKCLRADASGYLSQSFASFSTQSLEVMGIKPSVDDAVALEIIGILKRCLTQPAQSKIVLYEGLMEAGSRCPSLVGPCLDLLTEHAETIPSWTPGNMVITSKDITQLREPFSQLAQTIECLCYESITIGAESATQSSDNTVQKANSILNKWVAKAVSDDIHDLEIDKVSEWNPNNPAGRANFVFSKAMLSLYDVLIEHVWRQLDALKRDSDRDNLIGLLKRRKELEDMLTEKTVKRKEAKIGSTEAASFNVNQGEVFTSAQVIVGILEQLVPVDNSIECLDDIKEDLLTWTVGRALKMSRDLLVVSHPLQSIIASPSHLISVARHLMEFYIGVDCAEWMRRMENENPLKTEAAEAYSNICRFLCSKYKSEPSRITQIWQRNASTTSQATQGGGVTGSLVRQVHLIMTKLFPALLALEKDGNKKNAELEKQAKFMIQTSTAILMATTSHKAANATFKFLIKMMTTNTFASNSTLKDFLKFLEFVGLRSSDTETLFKETSSMADDVVQVLSDKSSGAKFACINHDSYSSLSDFLMHFAEAIMFSIKETIAIAGEFAPKDNKMDQLLIILLHQTEELSGIISRLLPLHTQFHVLKERLVILLTGFFATIQAPVQLLLTHSKIIPELVEWQSVTDLATLLKKKVQVIMAIADEKVGTLCPEEEIRGKSSKTRQARARKEEGIYVKYVKARENLQSMVLRLSTALKDDRLNLQIKNNSIGIRDFRLDARVLEEHIASMDGVTPRKRKRKNTTTDGTENDEEVAQNSSAVF